jgi:hypothetical protein
MVIRQKCYTVKEIETPGANPIKCKKKGDRDDDGHREQRFQEKTSWQEKKRRLTKIHVKSLKG